MNAFKGLLRRLRNDADQSSDDSDLDFGCTGLYLDDDDEKEEQEDNVEQVQQDLVNTAAFESSRTIESTANDSPSSNTELHISLLGKHQHQHQNQHRHQPLHNEGADQQARASQGDHHHHHQHSPQQMQNNAKVANTPGTLKIPSRSMSIAVSGLATVFYILL